MSKNWVDFQQIKTSVSIPDVLARLGIAEEFREKSGALVGSCPLPQHIHNPVKPNAEQFRIDCKKGLWLYKCFSPDCAGTPLGGGDVVSFVKAMLGLSDQHVRLWFLQEFGDRLDGRCCRAERGERKKKADPIPDQCQKRPVKPLSFRLKLDPEVPYLRERGIAESTIQRFGIGLCTRGVLQGYCAIPVYRHPREAAENPVAYLGRWPGEDFDEDAGKMRYKWPVGFEKSQVLYGLQEALEDSGDGDPLIVVEGCFSVYHLVQCGFPNVVASFGASLSDKQVELLIGTGRSLIIMYDGDGGGRVGSQAAVSQLVERAFVRMVRPPENKDIDRLTARDLCSLLGR